MFFNFAKLMKPNLKYIDIHTHNSITDVDVFKIENFKIGGNFSNKLHYSVGIHPWEIGLKSLTNILHQLQTIYCPINKLYNADAIAVKSNFYWTITDMLSVLEIAKKDNIIAIGEIGIDRHIKTDINLQINVLQKQLEIAEILNKPVVIHCVKAYSDFQKIVNENKLKFIFHSFNANENFAKYFVSKGAYLSFGQNLLNKENLQKILISTNINNIFFETDNSNANIKDIYKFASKLLNIDEDDLKLQIINNFKNLFGLDVRNLE